MKKFLLFVFFSFAFFNLHAQVNGDNDTIWTKTRGYQWPQVDGFCFDAKFVPEGNTILAGIGYQINEFDVQTGELIRKFDSCCPSSENPDNILRNIDFSEDNKYVVTAFGTPHVWDFQTGKFIKFVHECGNVPKFLKDNSKWIMACGSKIKIYNWVTETIEKETLVGEIMNNEKILTDNAFTLSNDKKYVALAYNKEEYDQNTQGKVWKNHLTLWNADDLTLIRTFAVINGYDREECSAAISPNNKYVGFEVNNVAYIYDFNTGGLINTFPVYSFNFFSDDKTLFICTEPGPRTIIQEIFTILPSYFYDFPDNWGVEYNEKGYLLFATGINLSLLNSNWKNVDVKEEPVNDVLDSVWYSKAIINLRSNYPHEVQFNIINNIGQNVYNGLVQPIDSIQQYPVKLSSGIYFITYEIAGRQYSQKFIVTE
jgi:WD40 repeat protein